MNGKTSFVMYTDYSRHWELLSGDEVKALDMAIFRYVETGQLPDFEGMLKMAFSFVRGNIDRDVGKWEETRKKRTAAAKAGAGARWGKNDEA
jgi:hypothetical protein